MVKIVSFILCYFYHNKKKKKRLFASYPQVSSQAAAVATITIRNTINSFLGGHKALAKSFDGASTFHSVFSKNPG